MANKLIKGTLILSVATLFTKILGSLFWAPFQNIAGDATVGLYRISFPFYQILLMIASAGIPITISKFVSERLSKNDPLGARKVLQAGSLILSLSGIICSCLLYFGAPFIANQLLHNPPTESSLRVLALAILIVPIMGAFRGFFQGHQQMMPTGISQVVEQLIRVGTVIGLTYWMVQQGFSQELVAAGATSGAVLGAVGGLLVVLWYNFRYQKEKRLSFPVQSTSTTEPLFSIAKKIFIYAIPISLATLVLPLIGLLDSFTVPRLLMSMGHSGEFTNELYGIYARGEPFVNVISTFSSSLTLALIPAIATHVVKKETSAVNQKIAQAWLMTLLVSLPSSLGLAVVAEPFNIAMYQDAKGTATLSVLAFSSIFSTLAVTSSGILQGLGYNRLPVRHLLIGAAVKVIGNFLFVPQLGITGSALAMVLAYLVVCVLNMWMVFRKTKVQISLYTSIIKPFWSALIMAVAMYGIYHLMNLWLITDQYGQFAFIGISLLLCLLGAIIYLIALLLTKTVQENELRMLPMGTKLIAFFTKIKLLRPQSKDL